MQPGWLVVLRSIHSILLRVSVEWHSLQSGSDGRCPTHKASDMISASVDIHFVLTSFLLAANPNNAASSIPHPSHHRRIHHLHQRF